jgi:hypothetical protein
MNIGEELVMAYLQYIKGCEFVQQNLYTTDIQGEIDVVGIDVNKKKLYVCEVAIHLQTGLQYVKDNQPNNAKKLFDKFSKDIDYAKKYFRDYEKIVMLWCPIVKNQKPGSKHNQMNDVAEVKEKINEKYRKDGIELETIINESFMNCFNELREYARTDTTDNKSPIIRLLQIEESLKKHLRKI